MLNKLFSKPLSLTIGDQTISFDTLAEFEFCLAGRTEVPAKKMASLVMLSPEALKKEAKSIKAVEKQFVEVLAKSIETPGSIASYLREIGLPVFSQDHNWRDIIAALNEKDSDYDDLRRVALVKYMQYLTSRQEVIKHTYSVKRQQPHRAHAEPSEPVAIRAGETMMFQAPEMEQPFNAAMRETMILDSALIEAETARKEEGFRRLPKGEAVVLSAKPGQTIEFLLSKHPFKLKVQDHCEIVDDMGRPHPLQDGKNIVGRDTVCNVVVNAAYRDVSRLHLIVERLGKDSFRFTDLSSHGTFFPASILGNAAAVA